MQTAQLIAHDPQLTTLDGTATGHGVLHRDLRRRGAAHASAYAYTQIQSPDATVRQQSPTVPGSISDKGPTRWLADTRREQ